MSRKLAAELGPDEAEVVYTFVGGWTIRLLTRLADQRREGEILNSCLRFMTDQSAPDPNCYSLRDTDNLPHATFSIWTIDESHDLSEIPDSIRNICFIRTPRALLLVDPHPLKPAHRERLFEFGSSDVVADCPEFPRDSRWRLITVGRAIDPGLRVHNMTANGIAYDASFLVGSETP